MPEADFPAEWPDWLRRELGTLGHGNHFAELQELAGIRLPDRARELGLDRRNLWLLVHSGSRGHGPALLERTPKGGLDPESEAGKRYLERHNRLLAWAKRSRRLAAEGFLSLAGAEGGCQAEVGAASAMAAAALVELRGGTAEQCAEAFAMALTNLEGLVCDPVAGLVEIPCIKRNVIGAMNAVSCADMALAGVVGHIPADEVIDAMAEVGAAMSNDLRETGIGGLAGTPTGKAIRDIVQMQG